MQYKKDIIERLGGEEQYQEIVVKLSERLMRDPWLSDYFGSYSLEDLCVHQREVLDLALVNFDDEEEEQELKACRLVLLHHTHLIMAGFNGSHFDRIKDHLTETLIHFWLESDVIEDVIENFEALKEGFFGSAWLKIHPTKYTQRGEQTSSPKEGETQAWPPPSGDDENLDNSFKS
jgi:hypothetical protein